MVAGGGLFRYGRAMAWPERVLLIVVVGFAVVAVEIGAIIIGKEYRAPGWLALTVALAFLFFDLWVVLRTIDWLVAGPARRRGDRVVR